MRFLEKIHRCTRGKSFTISTDLNSEVALKSPLFSCNNSSILASSDKENFAPLEENSFNPLSEEGL